MFGIPPCLASSGLARILHLVFLRFVPDSTVHEEKKKRKEKRLNENEKKMKKKNHNRGKKEKRRKVEMKDEERGA